MIGIFKATTSKADMIKFNGDYTLDHISSNLKITENYTEFYIEGTFIVDRLQNEAIYNLMAENSVLKVSDEYGNEYFRICNVKKQGRYIDIYARQISIQDSLTMFLEDVRPTNCNGNTALNIMFAGATTPNIFDVSSDIATLNTAYYINKSLYQAIHDDDNSFLSRWGGEIQRRAFTVKINTRIGEDRGVTIRSRKNLIGLEASSNLDSLMTRIYPKGYDGITIEEKYIDSPKVNTYPFIYSKTVKFEDIRVNDENYTEGFATLQEAQTELKRRVAYMYSIDKVDEIKASYRINFVELGRTEEYKDYSILEATAVGDTVSVFDDELGIDIKVRVTERKYDVLSRSRVETSLSNFKAKNISIGDIIAGLEQAKDEIENNKNDIGKVITDAKNIVTAFLEAGIKDSYVTVKKNEILVMDSTDINTAVQVWRWNKNGLGFSRTGYFGTYETAITADGKIVADFITTGILNASLIKAGTIMSLTGTTWINIADGTFNFGDKVKFDGTNFEIDLSGKDLATNADIKSTIEQSPDSVRIGFNQINSFVEITTASGIKVNHSDGSYTRMNGDGIARYVNGTAREYKYLTYYTEVILRQATEMVASMVGEYKGTIPYAFRAKGIKGFASVGTFYPFDGITTYGDHSMDNPVSVLMLSSVTIDESTWTYSFTYNISGTGGVKSYWQLKMNLMFIA